MKRLIRKLYYTVLLLMADIMIAGQYAFLGLTGFALFIFIVIECLAIKAVCTVCNVEPRMPLSFKLTIKWAKHLGKLGGKYTDEPDEDYGGRSYNEYMRDVEEYIKNQFTRW